MLDGIRGLTRFPGSLKTDADKGPGWKTTQRKRGMVLHYAGPDQPLHLGDVALVESYARYHVDNANFGSANQPIIGSDGIQYHMSIGRHGERWKHRDIQDVLWSCGAWPQNETALQVLVPLGGSQRATAPQLQALIEVADDWFGQPGRGNPRTDLWGHQELSWTSCPGTLMTDFVIPYRLGRLSVTTEDTSISFTETNASIIGGFYAWWKRNNGMVTAGLPRTNEFDLDDPRSPRVAGNPLPGKRRIQIFEGLVLAWYPELPHPWSVQRVHLNDPLFAEAMKRHPDRRAA